MRKTVIEEVKRQERESDVNDLFLCFQFRYSLTVSVLVLVLCLFFSNPILSNIQSLPVSYSGIWSTYLLLQSKDFTLFLLSRSFIFKVYYRKKAVFNTKILVMEFRHLIRNLDFFIKEIEGKYFYHTI